MSTATSTPLMLCAVPSGRTWHPRRRGDALGGRPSGLRLGRVPIQLLHHSGAPVVMVPPWRPDRVADCPTLSSPNCHRPVSVTPARRSVCGCKQETSSSAGRRRGHAGVLDSVDVEPLMALAFRRGVRGCQGTTFRRSVKTKRNRPASTWVDLPRTANVARRLWTSCWVTRPRSLTVDRARRAARGCCQLSPGSRTRPAPSKSSFGQGQT
jgi:hypothetical protein